MEQRQTPPLDVEVGAAMSPENASHSFPASPVKTLDKSPTYDLIVSNLTYKVSDCRTSNLKSAAAAEYTVYIFIQGWCNARRMRNQHSNS